MVLDIQRKKVPGFVRRPRDQRPSLICVHATRGQTSMDAQFQATVNWFTNPPNLGDYGPAADFLVGAKGEVACFFSDEDGDYQTSHAAWAAGYGDGNEAEWGVDEVAISVELAQPDNDTAFTPACIDAFVELARQLMAEFDIPAEHVQFLNQRRGWAPPRGLTGHDETENGKKLGKSDPGKRFPWADVISRLKQAQQPQQAQQPPEPREPKQVAPTPGRINIGLVTPVVIHFGATEPQIRRMAQGYKYALETASGWFKNRIGRELAYGDPVFVHVPPELGGPEDWQTDAWGKALGLCTNVGLPVWQRDNLVAILVDKIPHTTPGLGGASPDPWTGVVVKDGDALEIFCREVTGESLDYVGGPALFGVNVGMLIHELMHGMNANAHEDPVGDNIEMEWWSGLAADIEPGNREKLVNSIWFTPQATTTAEPQNPPGSAEPAEPEPAEPEPAEPEPGTVLTLAELTVLQAVRKSQKDLAELLGKVLVAHGVPSE